MRNREITRQQTHKVRQSPRDALQRLFEKLVPVPKVWRAARRTPYAPEATFWMFLGQTFSGDKSCTEAVVKRAAQYAGPAPSPDTGAYCKARKRLRQEDLETIDDAVIEAGHRTQEQAGRWWGRRVRVVDGSTVSMPDTPENQALYPQPGRQQPGCGFPMMRLVALFSLVRIPAKRIRRSAGSGSVSPQEGDRVIRRKAITCSGASRSLGRVGAKRRGCFNFSGLLGTGSSCSSSFAWSLLLVRTCGRCE